jgi:hypothetical protein
MTFFTKRWQHLTAPNRTIIRLVVHGGHVATGFIVAALVHKWFGLPPLVAAGIGGFGWVIFAEGVWDGAIRKLRDKLPVKRFRDHINDAVQILVGAFVFGYSTPQDVQLLAGFLVVYFIASPWIE